MSLIEDATVCRKLDNQRVAVLHLGEMEPVDLFGDRGRQWYLRDG